MKKILNKIRGFLFDHVPTYQYTSPIPPPLECYYTADEIKQFKKRGKKREVETTMSFNNLNYASMTPCEREGIMGNCGIDCRVFLDGDCPDEENMLEHFKEEIRIEKIKQL